MADSLDGQLRTMAGWGLPGVTPAQAGLLILMSACHGRCFFCAHTGVTNPPPEMITPWERILDFLGGYRGRGVGDLCLGGTEPSTHPRFRDTLALARKAGVERVQLMTSGVTLSQHARRWARWGVASVCVPLYGTTAHEHDGVVQVSGHHARVVAGLDAAREAGITVHVHTLAMRRTLPGCAGCSAGPGCAGVPDGWQLAVSPVA
jgi:molybdenum cofactor biosynthesis enzyme MoaA